MKYNFMWTTPGAGAPIVSIASYGITFNSAVIDLMKRPARVMIGYDDQQKVVGIKPIYDDSTLNSFPFIERERNGYVRIGNKDFVKYISGKTGIDFSKAIRFIGDWDDEDKLLIIDLNNQLDGNETEDEA